MADEIMSEEEAKLLRGSKALMDQLLKNKATRRDAEKLIKKLYPETTTTDDLAEPYIQRVEGLEKKLDEFFKRQDGEKLDNKLNGQIQELRDRGFTDDGIEKVKKLMVQESIPNALAAAAFWEQQNPPKPSAPAGYSPTDWGIGRKTDDADLTLLFQDEDAWAEKEATRVWQEESAKKGQILT